METDISFFKYSEAIFFSTPRHKIPGVFFTDVSQKQISAHAFPFPM
jgi:hypothetical protein